MAKRVAHLASELEMRAGATPGCSHETGQQEAAQLATCQAEVLSRWEAAVTELRQHLAICCRILRCGLR